MSARDSGCAVEYRPIEGFPRYRVGSDGSVWTNNPTSLKRFRDRAVIIDGEWMKLKPYDAEGYDTYQLWNGRYRHFRVSRLVLETFVGPPPDGHNAAHNNGNPRDNRLENLRWDTQKGNIADKKRHGTHQIGERHGCHILKEPQVREIRRLRERGMIYREIAPMFGVSLPTIQAVCARRLWGWLE